MQNYEVLLGSYTTILSKRWKEWKGKDDFSASNFSPDSAWMGCASSLRKAETWGIYAELGRNHTAEIISSKLGLETCEKCQWNAHRWYFEIHSYHWFSELVSNKQDCYKIVLCDIASVESNRANIWIKNRITTKVLVYLKHTFPGKKWML